MMDLYEAIEVVDNWLSRFDGVITDNEVLEAVRICLEAARDKAGI